MPRLEPGSAEASAYLEEHGYVVLRSVLSEAEVATAIDLTWAYLEGLGTGIVRRQPSSICSVSSFNRPLTELTVGAGRSRDVGRRPLAHGRARRDPARPRHRAVRGAVVHPRIKSSAGGVCGRVADIRAADVLRRHVALAAVGGERGLEDKRRGLLAARRPAPDHAPRVPLRAVRRQPAPDLAGHGRRACRNSQAPRRRNCQPLTCRSCVRRTW